VTGERPVGPIGAPSPRIVAELHARTAEPIAAAHVATQAPAGAKKRWRWLTTAWH
jgi:hypothetical protein